MLKNDCIVTFDIIYSIRDLFFFWCQSSSCFLSTTLKYYLCQDLIVAVEKMNSSLAKRSMKVDTIQQDEISLLGLGMDL